jgi:hypothetical protein
MIDPKSVPDNLRGGQLARTARLLETNAIEHADDSQYHAQLLANVASVQKVHTETVRLLDALYQAERLRLHAEYIAAALRQRADNAAQRARTSAQRAAETLEQDPDYDAYCTGEWRRTAARDRHAAALAEYVAQRAERDAQGYDYQASSAHDAAYEYTDPDARARVPF